MIVKVVTLASLIALAHAGLLLGDGIGGIGLSGGVGLGGIGLGSGISLIGGSGIGLGGKAVVDQWAPPKYEYKWVVQDPHTGDLKEKVEARIGDLTKTQWAWGEKDRQVAEARVIANVGTVKIGK